jgi:hypothetical protein
MMKKLVVALTTALLLSAVWAGPKEDAEAAYGRGDSAAEVGVTHPLAEKGEAWIVKLR